MILKTYARVVTEDVTRTLEQLRLLTGQEAHVRFVAGATEVVAIGDFCIIAAPEQELAHLRAVVGPVVVDNLEEVRARLVEHGSEITGGPLNAQTGTVLYARNPDGIVMEWLQYTSELTERLFPSQVSSEVVS